MSEHTEFMPPSYNDKIHVTDSIVQSVISQFLERSRVGQIKYGTNLDRTDLTKLQWIQHAQEELMDGILYLEKLKHSESSMNKNV